MRHRVATRTGAPDVAQLTSSINSSFVKTRVKRLALTGTRHTDTRGYAPSYLSSDAATHGNRINHSDVDAAAM